MPSGSASTPAALTLPDVDLVSSEGEKAIALCRKAAVSWCEIEVDAVLGGLRPFWDDSEIDLAGAVLDSDRHAICAAFHDPPAKCIRPKLPDCLGVVYVNHQRDQYVLAEPGRGVTLSHSAGIARACWPPRWPCSVVPDAAVAAA